MSDLTQDLRYAARQLARTPGFTSAAIATLALGIGVNTIFFAAVNAMVFRPVRAVRADGLFAVEITDKMSRMTRPLTRAQFRRVEAETPPGIARIGGFSIVTQPVVVTLPGRGERVQAEVVSGGYAAAMDLQPQVGRMLGPDDDFAGAPPAIVISDRLWREWFNGDRAPVGRTTLRIDTMPFTLVGVAPRGYRGRASMFSRSPDVWFTTADAPAAAGRTLSLDFWVTFVRPAAGVTPAETESKIHSVVTSGRGAPSPESIIVRLKPADSFLGSTAFTNTGLTIIGLAGLLLVAACANLANMLFARGAQRAGEVAVRLSLGAGRWRIFRLFLLESVLIASVAAICGLMLALVSTSFLAAAFPSFRDRNFRLFVDLTPDSRVFAFALAAGAAAALAVGVASAWHASAVAPLRALASSGVSTGVTRRGRWVRLGLVAVQVSAAVLLLMASAIYVRAAATALDRYVIFDTTPLATGLVNLQLHGYHEARARAFFDRFLNDVRQVPGVESAALADGFPGGTYAATRNVDVLTPREVPGESGEIRELSGTVNRLRAGYAGVSPQFLDTIGLPLRRGRDVQPSDQDSTPLVAIVSESVARLLWPGQDPLGKRLMFGNDGHWRTVVGVSADPVAARVESPLVSPANLVLIPAAQAYRPEMLIVIRSRTPPAHLEPLRAAARAVDDHVALFDLAPAEDSILAWAAPLQAATALTALLGVLALTIAALGVYGVIAYVVSLRTREFGIRAALGARPSQVIKLVLDEAIHLMLVGLLAGVLIASLTERYAQSQRFGFLPNEVWTWVLVPMLILIIGLAAAYGPAWRASRIDPNVALREL